MAARLPDRFAAHVAGRDLLRPGMHVLVAVSGGLDSVVLLHLLRFAPPVPSLHIGAAHFDHAMRSGSAADADWVRGLCRAWDVPLVAGRAERVLRGEAAARAARYAFLEGAARELRADRVVTAHQRDDQAETVLLRLARGTGLRGLGGIPERRGRLLRPLLPFGRAELHAYARARGVRYREDPTNRELAFVRNRVRHVLLPALERASPGAVERLAGLAGAAALAEAAWGGLLPELAEAAAAGAPAGGCALARGVVLGYDPPVRARVIRYTAQRLGVSLDRAATAAAAHFAVAAESGRSLVLGGGLVFEREFDRLVMYRPARSALRHGDRPLFIPGPGTGEGTFRLGGRSFRARWGPEPEPAPSREAFDPGSLRFPLELRGWQPGDRIRLAYGTKKLKKLLAERRVPRSMRDRVPVLAEQGSGGRVLWVVGVARAVPARPKAAAAAWHIGIEDERDS